MELKGCISKLKMLRWCSSPKRSGLRKEKRQENDRQKIQKIIKIATMCIIFVVPEVWDHLLNCVLKVTWKFVY